ncbi:GNAT family N-acetyltransferase [Achromobacter xylosoxidans]
MPTIATAVADNQRQLTHDAALAGVLHAPQIDFRDPEVLALHIQSFLESPLLAQHLSQWHGLVDVFSRAFCGPWVCPGSGSGMRPWKIPNLFQWRNHPSIRGVSNDSSPLIWGDHEVWLSKVLANADRPLLIGEDAEGPIGVVRFDITGDCAEVSIYLVPTRSAKGLGSELLTIAQAWLHRHRPDVRKLEARVLAANGPSHNLFLSAGFVPAETVYSKRLSQ